jgi:hypothetical protein
MRLDKHTLALLAALGATGVEVYCVYDGLKNATGAQLAAGVAIAILAPLVPAYIEGARRYFATVVFVFALACVIVASGSRVGGAIDRAQGEREQASRASKVAADTAGELKGLLDDARATAKKACADGKERTKGCAEANRRVDDLVGKWSAAGTTLAKAPVVAGEGDVARVAAWLGGYVTDRQVSLYLPLLWPVTMALVGAFFWGVWGDSRPAKPAPVITPGVPPPDFRKPPVPPPSPNVIDVLIDLVQPDDGRKRVEIAVIHRAYVAACKAGGTDVAPVESFGAQAKAFAEAAGIRTLASAGKVYWCGVKLVA